MEYLNSEAAKSRCVIAAYFVRDCPHVVEIGGFKTPITLFLTGDHRSVTVVDPVMREYQSDTLNDQPCRVRHIPATFQEVCIAPRGEYGFVMLGASLKHFSDEPEIRDREWVQLVDLVRGARVAVIEAAIDWPSGKGALDRLVAAPDITVRASIDLDLSANPGMDPQHFRRRLLVLESENS